VGKFFRFGNRQEQVGRSRRLKCVQWKYPIERVEAKNLNAWLANGTARIGITNYEALRDEVEQGRLGALIADESSLTATVFTGIPNRLFQESKPDSGSP
jgi:hypothetical protein